MFRDTKKRILLAKTEAAYLTDAAPTLADDAMETIGLTITPFAANLVTKDTDGKGFGNRPSAYDSRLANIAGGVYAGGGGAAGTAPRWGRLLAAAGFNEVTVALTSVTYNLISAAYSSLTCHGRLDGEIRKLLGVRGNTTFDFTTGQRPMINFDGRGFMEADPVADVYPASVDFTAIEDPFIINESNTQFLIDGYGACLQSLNIDVGAQLVNRDLPNCKEIHIPDILPTGSVTIDAPTLADKNFYPKIAGATVPIQLIHQSAPGQIVEVTGQAQLLNLQDTDNDGIHGYSFDLSFIDNDQFKVIVT